MPRGSNRSLAQSRNNSSEKDPTGDNYLLIIGIDAYQNGIPPLYNAVRDAKAFRDVLWDQYQFDKAHTIELYDEKATRSAIIGAFDKLLRQLNSEDNLVFYFSGHGELHPKIGDGYWIPVDAKLGDISIYVSNLEIKSFVKNFEARHVFGIVDSCFSSALFTQRSLRRSIQQPYSIPSRWLLTAGRLEPVSDGALGKHSPFAKSLLQQLKFHSGPALKVSELCLNVVDAVTDNTKKQTPRGEPLQDAGHQGGVFVFFSKTEKALSVDEAAPSLPEPSASPENKPPKWFLRVALALAAILTGMIVFSLSKVFYPAEDNGRTIENSQVTIDTTPVLLNGLFWLPYDLHSENGKNKYTYSEAKAACENFQPGYRLPSYFDWERLVDTLGGPGTDASFRSLTNGGQSGLNLNDGKYWSSTPHDTTGGRLIWTLRVNMKGEKLSLPTENKKQKLLCRCVKDAKE